MSQSISPDTRHLVASMETLGLVLTFLTRSKPFSEFPAATLVAAVQHQLSERNHLCLISDGRLAGYLGWVPVTHRIAQTWMENQGPLDIAPRQHAEALALTILSSLSTKGTRALIAAARNLNPGRRIYFRRENQDGVVRKANVLNVRRGAR